MAERTLTKEQLAVVLHEDGHAIVSAVPGSGKPETLISRLRHLVNKVDARRIGVFIRDAAEPLQLLSPDQGV